MDYQEDSLIQNSVTDSTTDATSITLSGYAQSTISLTNNWLDSNVAMTGGIYDGNANVMIGSTYQYPNISLSDNVYSIWGNDTVVAPGGKLSLNGEGADIEINGESIIGMLKDIRDRLNILQVSAEMEQEWDELRALREQYEAKLTECREKSRAWAALKQAG